jgi:hypothetical protein
MLPEALLVRTPHAGSLLSSMPPYKCLIVPWSKMELDTRNLSLSLSVQRHVPESKDGWVWGEDLGALPWLRGQPGRLGQGAAAPLTKEQGMYLDHVCSKIDKSFGLVILLTCMSYMHMCITEVFLFDWDFSGSAEDDADEEGREQSCYTFSRFADELVALMDDMKLRGAVFIGHSMAGMVGSIASIKRPDLFVHLVLVGASPR